MDTEKLLTSVKKVLAGEKERIFELALSPFTHKPVIRRVNDVREPKTYVVFNTYLPDKITITSFVFSDDGGYYVDAPASIYDFARSLAQKIVLGMEG